MSFSLLSDAFFITILMIGLRIISALVFIKDLGVKNTTLFGLSLSMPLTLLIATATLAYHNHTIDSYWYTVLVTTAVLEVIVVMLGVKFINSFDTRPLIKHERFPKKIYPLRKDFPTKGYDFEKKWDPETIKENVTKF